MEVLLILPVVFVILGIWGIIAVWLQRKRRAGAVLLDMGQFKRQVWWVTLSTVLMVLAGIGVVRALVEMHLGMMALLIGILLLSLGVFNVFSGWSRLEFAEGGVFYFPFALKWEWIESHGWGGRSNHNLIFKVDRGWWRKAQLPWPIASARREAIEDVLAQRLSHDVEG